MNSSETTNRLRGQSYPREAPPETIFLSGCPFGRLQEEPQPLTRAFLGPGDSIEPNLIIFCLCNDAVILALQRRPDASTSPKLVLAVFGESRLADSIQINQRAAIVFVCRLHLCGRFGYFLHSLVDLF